MAALGQGKTLPWALPVSYTHLDVYKRQVHNGVRTVSGGHGFAGIGRKAMLILLQARARELGVDMRFETEFKSAEEYLSLIHI